VDLGQKKNRLVERMKIIEELQTSRPVIVHLFEELVTTLPDGVYLTSIKQTGKSLEIHGVAESNTRVSAFMRNIDKSEWLESPDLKVVEVKAGTATGSRASEFTVFAQQTQTESEDDAS